MAHQPRPSVDALPAGEPTLVVASTPVRTSNWTQPRGVDDAYVDIGRRELPALTSLRFFAALYVVVHHLINIALLHTQGADADRAATWYLAWGTQGHVGVTFFFVLSGFILAWCYHRSFGTATGEARTRTTRRFWRARFARVWPLHAAMFLAFVPLAILEAGTSIQALFTTVWQGALNVTLLHAWWPFGGADGLADSFNAPSWTLSVEALFYLAFPAIAALLVHRLRWGVAQLAILAVGAWLLLGGVGLLVADLDTGEWIMRVLPATRLVDFVVGVALGLAVVQRLQRAHLHARPATPPTSLRWTLLEAFTLAAACASPLVWALAASDVLPDTLGTSWFHLPAIAAAILVASLERGAISRRLLAWRPLVWLGEVSYAMYLVHLFIVLAAYRAGLYDIVGPWAASALLVVVSIAVSGVVHERFEKPMRARLVGRS
ncbi:MAG: acyltransferase 3 [Thermoleophilia bacterium]|nr:acyltransferase 3 [Thermoleophilia bacterium]